MSLEPDIVAAAREGVLDLGRSQALDSMPLGRQLRLERRALALSVALGDLAGLLDLTAVTHRLSAFADDALDRAIGGAMAERTPDAVPAGFAAIALGKLGSRELNYSSDIDPILIYDPVTLPRRPREEPEQAALRIARRVVELLQSRNGDGYVLRVDLRLRPSPEATPIALPIDGAIAYYESQALAWERAAFIRARAAAGDRALGQRFLDTIRPFVWRRTLDFGAVDAIRDLSHRIRDHYAQGQTLGPGYDLKRGRGGIREVEFFAQIHQLIHGGRDTALREPATRDALAALARAGVIAPGLADDLGGTYALLRTIEHRVQMVDDRQTHLLPLGDALDRVARLDGMADGAALVERLRAPVERVGRAYDALDEREGSDRLPREAEALGDLLARTGFADPVAAAGRIEAWRAGRYPALRSEAARDALEAALPVLVASAARAPDAQAALIRLDATFERLPSAINVFRLLSARPALAERLVAILSHASPLADDLTRRPALLDGLIDASAFEDVGDVAALAATMRGGEIDFDYQTRLDHVRRVVGETRFALGAQIVAGVADPIAVGRGYARTAEAAIEVVATATVAEFARIHGQVPGSEFAILALGRMGGGLLTHASDLDLVYLFTGDFRSESDGSKPLGATLYYNRLAQRVTAALSVPTGSGALYPIDVRLRPSGDQGPLCVSFDSFARYQREEAWTWEHMALARARPVFGSDAARRSLAGVVRDVLHGSHDRHDVRGDALSMRARMAAHKPPAGPLDVKLLPGGLVDLEFAVHVRQLTSGIGLSPDLPVAIDLLVAAGLLPPEVADAHLLLMRALVALRLLAPDAQPPAPATRPVVAQALGCDDWADVLDSLSRARETVATIWAKVGAGGE